MPLIELSQVLASPIISGDVFDVIRRTGAVGANGRAGTSSQTIKNRRGQIITVKNENQREKDLTTGTKTISVITRFGLQNQTRHALPDIVVWRGDHYICVSSEDVTNYGSGFVETICTSVDGQDAAPRQK